MTWRFHFYICIFRIKRDIVQILKELLPTNDADVPSTPDKDGRLCDFNFCFTE